MSITIRRDTAHPMRHTVQIRDHQLVIDGTLAEGGEDAGPSAHDLYDAALGACKALTLAWYAQRKGIALGEVEIKVERDDSAEQQGLYRLATKIKLGGDLDETERQELLRVAGKCPVHKLMTSVTTEITTELT
jgi:putative redox protein